VKVLKSREAAFYLHSDVALTAGNITRAMAAEIALNKTKKVAQGSAPLEMA